MEKPDITSFLKVTEEHLNGLSFVKLTLSKPRLKQNELLNVIVSPVQLKSGLALQFVYRFRTRDITKNFSLTSAPDEIGKHLSEGFLQADLYSVSENVKLIINKKGETRILKHKLQQELTVKTEHNRLRKRILDPKGSIWMRETGITNERWEVRHEMKDKFIQINRYIELLEPEIQRLAHTGILRVADMGSGKGYLTFALYDYLQHSMGFTPKMTGIEYRADLVTLCNEIAKKAGFDGLEFIQGTIEETALEQTDILIALHACNTATDDAISRGIRSVASLIVVAPCCHKQIRQDMDVQGEMSEILKHGILMERQAEIVTDGIRALLMEASGYKTKVFEFVSTEHTPKNVMIVGRKTSDSRNRNELLLKIVQIKKGFGIKQHYLEKLLYNDLKTP
jgi:SAM-dependent methyltransferase